jgi:lysophospholipase L1-like esterase
MRNLLLLVLIATGVGVSRAADDAPYTPPSDPKSGWNFTVVPGLPNVLVLGDSISIGYTRFVRDKLAGKANVFRPMRGQGPDNCGDTALGLERIEAWLGARTWDAIHFNWGLLDLCYRNPASNNQGNRDKVGGQLSTTPDGDERNLEALVTRLEKTGAKLIWANTTVVPEGESGRFVGNDEKYNAIAARVMLRHRIPTDDLFTLTKNFAGRYALKSGDVHYTPEGYALLAAQVVSEIERVLRPIPGK